MSEALFDKQSWNRAMGPAIRGIGYLAAGFTLIFIIYVILAFLGSIAGIPELIPALFGILGPILAVFYFFLVMFKILDEEMVLKR